MIHIWSQRGSCSYLINGEIVVKKKYFSVSGYAAGLLAWCLLEQTCFGLAYIGSIEDGKPCLYKISCQDLENVTVDKVATFPRPDGPVEFQAIANRPGTPTVYCFIDQKIFTYDLENDEVTALPRGACSTTMGTIATVSVPSVGYANGTARNPCA